jgi:hypothetical protein
MKRRAPTQRHRDRAAERPWLRAEAWNEPEPRRERRPERAAEAEPPSSRRALGRVDVERAREAEALRVRCHVCGLGFVAVTELVKHRATHEGGEHSRSNPPADSHLPAVSPARAALIAAGLITPADPGDDAA